MVALEVPIKHLVIACQENRSFDHYYGYAPQVQAKGYGPPAGYSQPDAAGNPHYPFEFTSLTTPAPPHSWSAVHEQYDGGKMDGFYESAQARIGDGDAAIGYYVAKELPFYYSLFDNSALCANYFCSLLGPTTGLELRTSEGRASAGGRVRRDGLAGRIDNRRARVADLGPLGVPAHLRRARRLLRPRRAAASGRIWAQCARAAVGGVVPREAWRGAVGEAGRAQLDAEADRAALLPTEPHGTEPPVSETG